MSSVPPLKKWSTFLRFATSETASATPEDHGPIMKRAPSPSIASSARRVEVPACVAPSRVMYLIGRPRIFMPRSSSAMRMPRSLSGPTSANAPVWSQRPRITTSFCCARMMAGKPRLAAAAPIFRISLRFICFPPSGRAQPTTNPASDASLFRLDPRRAHQLRPFRLVVADEAREFFRRIARGVRAERLHSRLRFQVREDAIRLATETIDDRFWCRNGSEQTEPADRLVARESGLGYRRQPGQRLGALRARGRERLQLARAHLLDHRLRRCEEQIDVPGEEIGHRRAGAFVGHMEQF